MDIESLTVVHFRREKTYEEAEHEKAATIAKGQLYDVSKFERWAIMGELLMPEVPKVDRFIFINGVQYRVMDITWSIHLSEKPGQPSFDEPQVMVTVRRDSANSQTPYAPTEDFFQ